MPPRKKTNVEIKPDAEVNLTGEITLTADTVPPPQPPEAKTKGKRERKSAKHKVVAVITPDGIQGSFQPDVRRPLIAHLPIHSSDVQFTDNPFVQDPRPPNTFEAQDAGDIDPFAQEAAQEPAAEKNGAVSESAEVEDLMSQNNSDNFLVTMTDSEKKSSKKAVAVAPVAAPAPAPAPVMRKEQGPTTLLVQQESTKVTKELPGESSLACFWCCEQFAGRPCVIPIRVVEDVWNVQGNFCTPQCSMAYLLSELLDTHTRWERIALLNRLQGMNTNGRVYPAPNRECLQRFGGPLSSEEFRGICEGQRIRVDVHQPPMVSILASMDTKPIDFYETPLRNTFTPSYQASQKTEEQSQSAGQLKLKRNKPLKDKESTLDTLFQMGTKA